MSSTKRAMSCCPLSPDLGNRSGEAMFRLGRLTTACVCVLLVAAACSPRGREEAGSEGTSGSEQGRQTVAVFLSNGGDPYFQNKSYGYVQAGKDLDANVELFDAGGYENVEKQIAQVEDAIQRGVDAIVLTPVDSTALCGPTQEALDAGIPVVADDIMLSCDFKVPVGVSENSVNVGFQECKYMAEKIGGEGNFVMLKGPSGAGIAIDRVDGCKKALSEYPGIDVLAEQWGPSNIETGNNLMDDFIAAHRENIDAVFTFGAITALGAVNALQSAGFEPGQVSIATIDYHPEVVGYMEEGWIDGTIPAQPVRLAYTATEQAVNLAGGDEARGKEGVDPCCEKRLYTKDEYVVDSSNIDQYDPSNAVAPDGWSPPLQS
jgi:ribose transport system substrate-binding protein